MKIYKEIFWLSFIFATSYPAYSLLSTLYMYFIKAEMKDY